MKALGHVIWRFGVGFTNVQMTVSSSSPFPLLKWCLNSVKRWLVWIQLNLIQRRHSGMWIIWHVVGNVSGSGQVSTVARIVLAGSPTVSFPGSDGYSCPYTDNIHIRLIMCFVWLPLKFQLLNSLQDHIMPLLVHLHCLPVCLQAQFKMQEITSKEFKTKKDCLWLQS